MDLEVIPIEMAYQCFTGLNEPLISSMSFSKDGFHLAVVQEDANTIRWVDAVSLKHCDTFFCEGFGVHQTCFTHSSDSLVLAPSDKLCDKLYLFNSSKATIYGALSFSQNSSSSISLETSSTDLFSFPTYSSVAQSPVSDVFGAIHMHEGRLVLFHPLCSGAIAATPPRVISTYTSSKVSSNSVSTIGNYITYPTSLSFSSDGNYLCITDPFSLYVWDYRQMLRGPLYHTSSEAIFNLSNTASQAVDDFSLGSKPSTSIANHSFFAGAVWNYSVPELLITSTLGEVVTCDVSGKFSSPKVTRNFFHGHAQHHLSQRASFSGHEGNLIGEREENYRVLPAVFANQYDSKSLILQVGTVKKNGTRHILFYSMKSSTKSEKELDNLVLNNSSSYDKNDMPTKGVLRYVVPLRDTDPISAVSINPTFSLFATSSHALTWWILHACD